MEISYYVRQLVIKSVKPDLTSSQMVQFDQSYFEKCARFLILKKP